MRKFLLLSVSLLLLGVGGAKAEKKNLTFSCADHCAARWDAESSTFSWGSGGWNPAWTFMTADGISGDLSSYTFFHMHVSDFTNATENQLTVVFTYNDGSWPPSGPTKEFVVAPDANGDVYIDMINVDWGDCKITKIQDLTIYGGTRTDNTIDASVKITEAYLEDSPIFCSMLLDEELTLDDVKDGTTPFALVRASDNKVLYYKTQEGWNNRPELNTLDAAIDGEAYYYKLEAIKGNLDYETALTTARGLAENAFDGDEGNDDLYLFHVYDPSLVSYPSGSSSCYLSHCGWTMNRNALNLGSNKFGADVYYNCIWKIAAVSGGYTIQSQSLGNKNYIKDAGGPNASAEIWKFYSLREIKEFGSVSFTTTAELCDHLFMLTKEVTGIDRKLYFQDGWDVKYANVNDAEAVFGGSYFKAEPIEVDTDDDGTPETYYALHIYGADGSDNDYYNTWLGHYLNFNGSAYNVHSGACKADGSHKYGTDLDYGALWTPEFNGSGEVALKNKAHNKYLNMNTMAGSAEPVFFIARNRLSYTDYERANSTADKFLSFSFPYDATISGAKVYTLSNVDNTTTPTVAYLEEVGGNTVSAGKGYILKTTAASNVTINAEATTFSKGTKSNGALVAVFGPKKAPADSYVLSNNEWLKVISDDEPSIKSTRAYLDLSKAVEGEPGAAVKFLTVRFDNDDTTAVSEVKGLSPNPSPFSEGSIFNVAGQRVQKPSRGIFIVNGKKVVIK